MRKLLLASVIIASGYMADIASHADGTNAYNVSIKPQDLLTSIEA